MKKRNIAVFVVFMILASFFNISSKVFAASASIKVQFFNTTTASSSNSIGQSYKVTNTSSNSLDLSTITLRYYYTEDGSQNQTFWCDYSSTQSITTTSKVTYKFAKLATPTNTADCYAEIGFKSDAGTLAPGESVTIQGRITKSDWSNYNQANDYSFNATAAQYTDWTKVTGYVGGVLNYGQEPNVAPAPVNSTIAPTTATFDKNAANQADIPLTLTLNGNTLTSITNGSIALVENKDYTVSNSNVILSKTYLANLAKGSYNLIFNFSAGTAANFSLNVVDTTPVASTTINVGKVVGKPGDTVVVPVSLSGVIANGLDGLTFNVSYDSTLLQLVDVKAGSSIINADVNFQYTNVQDSKMVRVIAVNLSPQAGTNVIAKDGDVAYISFKINASAAQATIPLTLNNVQMGDTNGNLIATNGNDGNITIEGTSITVGKITGKPGDTVTVPVTLSAIPAVGLNECQFDVNYDSTVLSLISVAAGNNVVSSDLNFSYQILSSGVEVIVVNLSSDAGTNAISKDGDVCYLTFTIKANAKAGITPITLNNMNLGDANENQVTTTSFDGSISVVTK